MNLFNKNLKTTKKDNEKSSIKGNPLSLCLLFLFAILPVGIIVNYFVEISTVYVKLTYEEKVLKFLVLYLFLATAFIVTICTTHMIKYTIGRYNSQNEPYISKQSCKIQLLVSIAFGLYVFLGFSYWNACLLGIVYAGGLFIIAYTCCDGAIIYYRLIIILKKYSDNIGDIKNYNAFNVYDTEWLNSIAKTFYNSNLNFLICGLSIIGCLLFYAKEFVYIISPTNNLYIQVTKWIIGAMAFIIALGTIVTTIAGRYYINEIVRQVKLKRLNELAEAAKGNNIQDYIQVIKEYKEMHVRGFELPSQNLLNLGTTLLSLLETVIGIGTLFYPREIWAIWIDNLLNIFK